jgi:hypothetical protein
MIDVVAIVATGNHVVSFDQSHNDEEFKKSLGAILLAGYGLIMIDNCEHELESSLLNIAVTQPVFGPHDREADVSETPRPKFGYFLLECEIEFFSCVSGIIVTTVARPRIATAVNPRKATWSPK